jgi:hypothetical protein
VPGYERAELSAELMVAPSTQELAESVRRAAGDTGLAREAGPETTVLSGGRREVLEAVVDVVNAALDAGARGVEVTIEAEGDAPRFDER